MLLHLWGPLWFLYLSNWTCHCNHMNIYIIKFIIKNNNGHTWSVFNMSLCMSLPSNLLKQVLFLSPPLFRWRNGGTERQSTCPRSLAAKRQCLDTGSGAIWFGVTYTPSTQIARLHCKLLPYLKRIILFFFFLLKSMLTLQVLWAIMLFPSCWFLGVGVGVGLVVSL